MPLTLGSLLGGLQQSAFSCQCFCEKPSAGPLDVFCFTSGNPLPLLQSCSRGLLLKTVFNNPFPLPLVSPIPYSLAIFTGFLQPSPRHL